MFRRFMIVSWVIFGVGLVSLITAFGSVKYANWRVPSAYCSVYMDNLCFLESDSDIGLRNLSFKLVESQLNVYNRVQRSALSRLPLMSAREFNLSKNSIRDLLDEAQFAQIEQDILPGGSPEGFRHLHSEMSFYAAMAMTPGQLIEETDKTEIAARRIGRLNKIAGTADAFVKPLGVYVIAILIFNIILHVGHWIWMGRDRK